jgi:hypothetical protein
MKKLLVLVVVLCGVAWAEERGEREVAKQKVVVDFADKAVWKDIGLSEGVTANQKTSTIDVPARKESSVTLWHSDKAGWKAFDEVRITLTSTAKGLMDVAWEITDTDGKAAGAFVLDPGANDIRIPLQNLYDGTTGLINPDEIKSVALRFGRMKDAFQFKPGKVELVVFPDVQRQVKVFDFGPKDAIWPGAIPVSGDTKYTDELGYGLTGDAKDKPLHPELMLLGDGVRGEQFGFSAKMENGEYEVRAVAYQVAWDDVRDNANYTITAQGKDVYVGDLNLEKFLSFEHHYYGADIFFNPKVSIFDQYFKKYYEPHAFTVNVTDGKLELGFKNCTLFTLFVWPKTVAGQDVVKAVYKDCGFDVWKKSLRYQAHKQEKEGLPASEADKKRGYSVFTRGLLDKVYPEDKPCEGEAVQGVNIAACAGEITAFNLAVHPWQNLGMIEVTLVDFQGEQGTITSKNVQASLVKEQLQKVSGPYNEAVPTALVPVKPISGEEGWNRQYWFTVSVPKAAVSGTYKGQVVIKVEQGAATALPITLTVRPIQLEPAKASYGMWDNGVDSAHQCGAFEGSDKVKRDLIEAEISDWAAHGMTGYSFRDPQLKKMRDDGTAEADFSTQNIIVDTMKHHGMGAEESVMGVLGAVNYKLMRWGLKEFSPEFNKAYKSMLADIVDWAKLNDLNIVLYLVDEPRERDVQDWNRNRVDSIKYLKLAREVPGTKTTITLMGDRDYFGDDYTPMLPLMDVAMTHAWDGSRQIFLLANKEKIAKGIPYNNGWSRYVWGFYVWKADSCGNWQWVYSWENSNAWLPLFMPNEPSAALAYPGGYAPTIKYEWVREGINDYRYLKTLELAIAASPESAAAKSAKEFLKNLKKFLPQYPETGLKSGADAGSTSPGKLSEYCPAWREQIAEFIMAINGAREAKILPEATAMFPKTLAAFEKSYTVKMVKKAPVVDGKLDDAAWEGADVAGEFVSIPRAEAATVATEVRIVTDGKMLYLGFHCVEPRYGELKAYAMNRDEACWEDDAVEIFLDTKNDQKTYYQFIVNTLGTIEDGQNRDDLWNGDVKTAVQKGKGFWDLEVSISLSCMNAKGAPGETWGMNLCRDRYAGRAESSSWAFVGTSFHTPEKFGKLVFEKK